MFARPVVRVGLFVFVAAGFVSACGGSTGHTAEKPAAAVGSTSTSTGTELTANPTSSTAAATGGASAFVSEAEVTALFGTRPQQTSDAFGIGGPASNCLWKATTGGKVYLLQIGIFGGVQHYADSDRSGAKDLAGLGDRAFIKSGDLSGVTIEFVHANTTYFFLFSIAKTVAPSRNDANARADQFVALIKRNASHL